MDVGEEHAADEAVDGGVEWKPSAEFRGRDSQHGTQVPPEALGG